MRRFCIKKKGFFVTTHSIYASSTHLLHILRNNKFLFITTG